MFIYIVDYPSFKLVLVGDGGTDLRSNIWLLLTTYMVIIIYFFEEHIWLLLVSAKKNHFCETTRNWRV